MKTISVAEAKKQLTDLIGALRNGTEITSRFVSKIRPSATQEAARSREVISVPFLKEGPVLLLLKGQPCAALVGLDERFDREAFSVGRNKRLRRIMDDACRRTKETGGTSFADILREVRQQPARKTRTRPQAGRG